MTLRRTGSMILCVLLLPAAAGCGFFSRTKSTFYSLDVIAPEGTPAANTRGVPIGIDGVELPPGIDRRGIVVRGADQKLEIRETHQWSASLEEMVTHTLAFDLANRLPEGMVVLPGQAKPAAMRSLYVTFEDLAAGPDRVFVLDARWTLAGPALPGITRRERVTVNLSSMDSAQIATATSQALAMLAERIVRQL